MVNCRNRFVVLLAMFVSVITSAVVNGQTGEAYWSFNTYQDVDDNDIFGLRFQSPNSQFPNLDIQTSVSNSIVLINVCANVPKPSTVNDVSFDWNHIETLELKPVQNVLNGLRFSGGHFGVSNFPATFTVNNKTYTVTYTKIPANPLPDKPFEIRADVKQNGQLVTVERPQWTVFPDNWTQVQMRAAVTQAWGIIKPTLTNRVQGGTERCTLPAPLNFMVELKWAMSCDQATQKWKIKITTAYPKL